MRLANALAVALVCTLGAQVLEAAQKPITASDAWIKLPAEPDGSVAAFVTVDNPTMYDVYLVTATTDVADEVQFREPETTGSPETKAIKEISAPAYGKVELAPGGVHLALGKLKRPLKVGETIVLTLTTDGGVVLQVGAVVK